VSREAEFAEFYGQHYRLILTVAQQRLQVFADAEDVTAEVFRVAWSHHQSGNELHLAWLYQVLRNMIGNQYRKEERTAALQRRLENNTFESDIFENPEILKRILIEKDGKGILSTSDVHLDDQNSNAQPRVHERLWNTSE